MRFTVQYPIDDAAAAEQAADPEQVTRFAQAAEAAGFDGIAFTDHPAPPLGWSTGPHGHAALDPFAALSYCAAVTPRLRLVTYLAVLPYRAALVTAKAAATVDRLSNGRLVLGIGGGYLRGEFEALGAAYESRTRTTTEALAALTAAWSGRPSSADVALQPLPVQHAGPPIWIGGNSRRARELVVRYAVGWAPLLVPAPLAGELGTSGFATADQLAAAVDELRAMFDAAGRDRSALEIHVKGAFSRVRAGVAGANQASQSIAAMQRAGATGVVIHPEADDRPALLDVLAEFGEVIAQFTPDIDPR